METSGSTPNEQQPLNRTVSLGALCAAAGVPCPAGNLSTPIHGVTAVSARVRPGWLFAALPGSRTDGRAYITDALHAGAAAVLCQQTPDAPPVTGDAAVISPPPGMDPRAAFARLVSAWYGDPGKRLRLVGITGTNGKTTVTAMLCHTLRTAGVACGCIGTLGYRLPSTTADTSPDYRSYEPFRAADERAAMTTPAPEELYAILADMADRVPAGTRPTVVMEVSSHALAQGRVDPLTFDLAVFTNLSPEHLDYHGTMEEYFEAKKSLFRRARIGVINGDDVYARRLPLCGLPVDTWYVCTVGQQTGGAAPSEPESDLPRCIPCRTERIRPRRNSGRTSETAFRFSTPDLWMNVSCPLPGDFTESNASLTAAAALALDISPRAVKEALEHFPGVPGRLERIPTGSAPFAVYIDYAHTPDALERLLLTFHKLCCEPDEPRKRPGRIILLFGCGGDRDRGKRKLMARIASRMADAVIVTSDNSRNEDPAAIIRDILTGIDRESEYAVIPDRAEAIRYAVRTAHAGDVILLCGKGHETYEIDRTGKHPFDERLIVREALRTYGAE